MLKIYKYLFYREYSFLLKHWGKEDQPEWSALFVVSFIMFLNIGLLLLLIQLFIDIKIFSMEVAPKKEIISIGVLLGAVNYVLFIYRNKYELIVEEFKCEPPHQRKKNTNLLYLFIILSLILPYLVIYLFYRI
jgi:hypothetical protein